jgi:hypothetical protein
VARGGSYIKDRGGADTYRGNADAHDTVSYNFWGQGPRIPSSGIDANLKRGRVDGPDGETDRLISIEQLRGTLLDDVFRGDGQDNIFHGLRGMPGWSTGAGSTSRATSARRPMTAATASSPTSPAARCATASAPRTGSNPSRGY